MDVLQSRSLSTAWRGLSRAFHFLVYSPVYPLIIGSRFSTTRNIKVLLHTRGTIITTTTTDITIITKIDTISCL
jgi:hypothetical protein